MDTEGVQNNVKVGADLQERAALDDHADAMGGKIGRLRPEMSVLNGYCKRNPEGVSLEKTDIKVNCSRVRESCCLVRLLEMVIV